MRAIRRLALIAALLSSAACAHASSGTAAEGRVGDRDNGKLVFSTNCATCHGASGTEGGVGPSLRDERIRKSVDQTIAWIEHPEPPMPQLYPSPLTLEEVEDVAAYVQSL